MTNILISHKIQQCIMICQCEAQPSESRQLGICNTNTRDGAHLSRRTIKTERNQPARQTWHSYISIADGSCISSCTERTGFLRPPTARARLQQQWVYILRTLEQYRLQSQKRNFFISMVQRSNAYWNPHHVHIRAHAPTHESQHARAHLRTHNWFMRLCTINDKKSYQLYLHRNALVFRVRASKQNYFYI